MLSVFITCHERDATCATILSCYSSAHGSCSTFEKSLRDEREVFVFLQAMLNPYPGSNGSLSSLQNAQGGSHPNLVGLAGRSAMPPGRGQHRGASQGTMESPRDLLSAGSQHLSASQLLALVNQVSSPLTVSKALAALPVKFCESCTALKLR